MEQDEQSAKLRLTIHEGRNRQIRKMCEQCGLEVRRLKRVAVGELPLDPKIKSGAWRELTAEELALPAENRCKFAGLMQNILHFDAKPLTIETAKCRYVCRGDRK